MMHGQRKKIQDSLQMGAADSTEASEIIYKQHGFMSQKKWYLIVKYLAQKFEYL